MYKQLRKTTTALLFIVALCVNTLWAQTQIDISGKMTFEYGLGEADLGVYGLRVYLYFDDADDSNGPELLYTDQDIEGKTYDILDEQGNYSFNFTYDGDMSQYDSVLVWPTTQNAAAIILDGNDGTSDDGGNGPGGGNDHSSL